MFRKFDDPDSTAPINKRLERIHIYYLTHYCLKPIPRRMDSNASFFKHPEEFLRVETCATDLFANTPGVEQWRLVNVKE
ncbi:MAG: hypothetical protein ACSHYA_04040 [Opitutaceae bacterium]